MSLPGALIYKGSMKYEGKTRLPTVSATAILGFFSDYRFLSNFCYSPVYLDSILYPTSEHAYMAEKTNDFELRRHIARLKTPLEARNYGQTIQLIDNWKEKRIPAMYRVLTAKFLQDEVRVPLLATGTKYLEETNDWDDTFWGCCGGKGANHLGKTLMRVRDDIFKELK